jgi:hypothetical protein
MRVASGMKTMLRPNIRPMTRLINSNVTIKEAIPAKSPNNFPLCPRIVRKEETN